MDFVADFNLDTVEFDAVLEVNPTGAMWGDIAGDIYDQTDLINALDSKQDVLTAGDNIQIEDNVISATDTTYTAGTGISIENGVISNTQTSAEWGNIQGDIDDQTDLKDALDTLDGAIDSNHQEISSISNTMQSYGDIVTYDAASFATSAQGDLADSALQPNDNITELTNNAGYITGIDSEDVTGALGYTPYDATNPDGFITSSAVKDSTITIQKNGTDVESFTLNQSSNETINITVPTQASDINAVPTSRTVNSKALSSDITLSASDVGALSSSTTINDLTTAEQQAALNSGATTTNIGQIATNTGDISTINGKIPSQASSSNQLADKEFVNSSISSNTANFIGTFATVSDLEAYSGTVTNNDYAFVVNSVITNNGDDWTTVTALNTYDKTLLTNFDYAWVINSSNFDLYRFDIVEQQWDLRVSNTAKADVTLNTAYNRYKATVSNNTVTWEYEYTLNNSSFTASQWAAINSGITSGDVSLINTAIQPSDLATVATSGSYTDLTNKPTIPDAQVQSNWNETDTNSKAYIQNKPTIPTVPTNVSAFTNDSGYITSSSLSGYQTTSNLVTSISSSSTDGQYPSAKCVYDLIGDIETALNTINSGSST